MNPEFRRQLWLQLSVARLVTLPLLLAACFAAVYLSFPDDTAPKMAAVSTALFVVLVFGMGSFAAGASVMDEITDRTWDQQRMSAMQPWAMTWGKLAGASAYGWYGGALCLLVALPSALKFQAPSFVLHATLMAACAGVFAQALQIAINLQIVKAGKRLPRRGGAWATALFLLWMAGPLLTSLRGDRLVWWSLAIERMDFALASMLLFMLCAVITAWRSMAEVLAVRQLPWGWPALALVAMVYITGFTWEAQRANNIGLAGLGVCTAFTYLALLIEPQQRPLWQRLLNRLHARQWRTALLQLPHWPTTLLLALAFAVISVVENKPHGLLPWTGSQAWSLQPLTVVLLMGRDCTLALYFAFSKKARQSGLAFVLTMVVLYGLVPWLLNAAGSVSLLQLALPLTAASGSGLAIAAVHLAIALGLLNWRWRATAAQ